MEAKVLKAYIDRETGELHRVGESVKLTKARAEELSGKGFVKAEDAEDKPRAKRSTAKRE